MHICYKYQTWICKDEQGNANSWHDKIFWQCEPAGLFGNCASAVVDIKNEPDYFNKHCRFAAE